MKLLAFALGMILFDLAAGIDARYRRARVECERLIRRMRCTS